MKKTFELSIPAIKCDGCVTAIKTALDNNNAVFNSAVSLETNSAFIETELSLFTLIAIIKTAGFEATEQKPTTTAALS